MRAIADIELEFCLPETAWTSLDGKLIGLDLVAGAAGTSADEAKEGDADKDALPHSRSMI